MFKKLFLTKKYMFFDGFVYDGMFQNRLSLRY